MEEDRLRGLTEYERGSLSEVEKNADCRRFLSEICL